MIGLAAGAEAAAGKLRVALNGRTLELAGEIADRRPLGGTARALRFSCPPGIARPGENTLELSTPPDTPAGEVVWAEIRVTPR